MIVRGLLVVATLSATLALADEPQSQADLEAAYFAWRRGRPELREGVPHSTWTFDRGAAFRLGSDCLAGLRAKGVRARPLPWAPTPAPTPVIVEDVTGGVTYRKRRDGAPMVVACALAERLPRLSALLREHDIRRVEVLSAYRREPAVSYHHMGLALDITAFVRASDVLHVERDWPELRGPTCSTRPEDDSGRVLHAVVCAMHRSQIFSTVITPSYGRGHDNHLHVDIRPGDTWRFLR